MLPAGYERCTMRDGETLATRHWLVPRARGCVLVVHGLGEHLGRYHALAQRLNAAHYDVLAYDHYGHGMSSGPRGGLARHAQMLEHLGELHASLRHDRRIVLGHSLGGLVVAAALARGMLQTELAVLSSPALAVHMARWQKAALNWLPKFAPNLTLANGLDADRLSHDRTVVQAYREDPLVHDRISARLGAFVANEGPLVLQAAPHWSTKTLLLYAGDDRLVNPQGSAAFATAAPRDRVTAQCFPSLYHEIFNELDPAPLTALVDWLDAAD
jgi:alpha-beta hydrolase superfamily lysophospholipase